MSLHNTLQAQVKSAKLRFALKTLLSHKVPEISVSEAFKSKNKYLFLDARENNEYAVSHIPSAVFIGARNFDLRSLSAIPKDKPLIVYCSIGKRSEDIVSKMIKAGYTNVHNLYGGIFEWTNEGFPLVDQTEVATSKVHAYNRFWGMLLDKGDKVY